MRSDVRPFGIGNSVFRGLPFITLLLDLPRFGLAMLQSHVPAWISRAAETDFVPSPRVGVIGLQAILHHQSPVAMDRHFLPDFRRSVLWLGVMDRFQKLVLLAPGKLLKGSAIRLSGDLLNGLKAEPISIAVGGMVAKR